MSPFKTQELKGLAILMVLFGHIGYFLFPGSNFLWPLSVDAGVGVNMFFILSAYGLCASWEKLSGSYLIRLTTFYRKRVLGVFPELWVILGAFFLLDLFLLDRSYGLTYIVQSILGFYPSADLTKDVNSPLWYITPILVYYIVFPLLYVKKLPLFSAGLVALVGLFLTRLPLPVSQDVLKLYKLHYLAFPLGIFLYRILPYLSKAKIVFTSNRMVTIAKLTAVVMLLTLGSYTSIKSGVGQGVYKEQLTSLVTAFSFILAFTLVNIQSKLLALIGNLSYEIYLLHWPVLSRYDFLYNRLNDYVATIFYLLTFMISGWLLKILVQGKSTHFLSMLR